MRILIPTSGSDILRLKTPTSPEGMYISGILNNAGIDGIERKIHPVHSINQILYSTQTCLHILLYRHELRPLKIILPNARQIHFQKNPRGVQIFSQIRIFVPISGFDIRRLKSPRVVGRDVAASSRDKAGAIE